MPCRPTRQGTAVGADPEAEPKAAINVDAEADVDAEGDIDVGSVDRGTMNRAYTVSPELLYLTSYSRYQGEDPNRTSAAARGASAS